MRDIGKRTHFLLLDVGVSLQLPTLSTLLPRPVRIALLVEGEYELGQSLPLENDRILLKWYYGVNCVLGVGPFGDECLPLLLLLGHLLAVDDAEVEFVDVFGREVEEFGNGEAVSAFSSILHFSNNIKTALLNSEIRLAL